MKDKELISVVLAAVMLISIFAIAVPVVASKSSDLDLIKEAIKEQGASWTAGETSVSGLSIEEKKMLCGAKMAPAPEDALEVCPPVGVRVSYGIFDWRNKDGKNWMTPVKDQGFCGSCWAFSVLGVVEAMIKIDAGDPAKDIDLSEQHLVSDCCWNCGDCGGGSPTIALDYIKANGVPDEICYPYKAINSACTPCSDWTEKAWEIEDYVYVDSTTDAYKWALEEYGPMSVVLNTSEDWFYYTGGIYEPTWTSEEFGWANHAVVLVGYNAAGGYWIVKNSWGSGWGEDGYGKVKYGNLEKYNYAYAIRNTGGPTWNYFDVKYFSPWPGYATAAGRWETGDFNGDGKTDLIHIAGGDAVGTWISKGDGTYDVKSFSPWPGYATAAGRWETGDFNGDGKTDLIHIAGGDAVGTWISKGDGTYDVKSFSPWPGYATAAGRWETGDFNGDGKTDLIHIVGGDYVHPWISKGDGTYDVKSFSPWPGYATAAGRWETGDFNGDGKTDLIHIVGGDYVHPWISNGDGTFAVLGFSPWAGYATAAGRWETGDLNGDGNTDLIHIVGGDYVGTWISKGDGTYDVKSFSPWPGYATAAGRWETGDFNGDGKTDLIHIVGGDYVHPWISNGDGTFAVLGFSPWAGYATAAGRWETGDLNGDGNTDLIHIVGGDYVRPWISKGQFIIDCTPPEAIVHPQDQTVQIGQLAYFDASDSNDPKSIPVGVTSGIDRYVWDFGDGTVITGTGNPGTTSHEYASVGTYTVMLKLWDKAGNDGTGTAQTQVGVEVIPEFTTIAIPAVTILLLVFLISRRKQKR